MLSDFHVVLLIEGISIYNDSILHLTHHLLHCKYIKVGHSLVSLLSSTPILIEYL